MSFPRHKSKLLFATLMILTLAFSCSEDILLEQYVPQNQREREIRSLLIRYQDAKNRFDLEQFIACLHDQGLYSFRSGAMISKEKLKELLPDFWAALKAGNSEIYPITHECFTGDHFLSGQLMNPKIAIRGDTAKVTTMYTSGWWRQPHYISLVRDNGRWLIKHLDWKEM